ncbi:CRISPR system Cascade subunit CasC [Syntrophus gentianae]|uniref:CRISPR system Cascade subunit CasC n=1 Tax=Syntrophus gentianae TaxID=43775 RepID=A0A1H8A893_9BACT|nr:type I-E CRISPR-associated protein Cas7/Cse4/CasC [Syntrophus gentianae]SEM66773.1 CRISPR system Cascade subunit CasC [Syntrophus gentianae]
MDKNFINFHILISHSPSCLNRDDMNMQKSAIFGGKRRVRISSQSLKRTMRTSEYYKLKLGDSSIRSHHLDLLKEEFLKDNDIKGEFNDAIVQEALERFVKTQTTTEENSNDEVDDDSESKPDKKLAVAPWIRDEFKVICRIVKEVRDADLTEEEEKKANNDYEKQKKPKKGEKKQLQYFCEQIISKKIEAKMKESSAALLAAIGSAKDVALAGRMATSGLMTTIEGALAVAHVITTHAVDTDIDWFTAVDDLQKLGSGHLDTQEFSSGVFYRYASLNLRQLQVNLGLIPDIMAPETDGSRKEALEVASHVLHMLTTEVPSAKQQSFAAHNLADLAMVSFSDIPVSLANAFEEPVKPGPGFIKPSVKALHDYWQAIHAGYGLNERCAEFAINHVPPDGMMVRKTLEDLKTWVRANGKG